MMNATIPQMQYPPVGTTDNTKNDAVTYRFLHPADPNHIVVTIPHDEYVGHDVCAEDPLDKIERELDEAIEEARKKYPLTNLVSV